MRNVSGCLLIVALFSACGDPTTEDSVTTKSVGTTSTSSPDVSSGSSVAPSKSDSSTNSNGSTTTVSMPNQFLYVLVNGKVCGFPIDTQTKDIIQPQYGGPWCVAPTSGSFYSMVMDPTGKYLYASSSAQGKIYMYSIIQNFVYTTYGSRMPLNALSPATFATNISSAYMSFGSNGNLYIQNYLYTPARLDKLTVASSGLLSLVGTVVAAGETSSYGMSFAHIGTVSSGDDTYIINTGSNQIEHYQNGIIQQTFQTLISGTVSAIQLH